MNMTWAEIIARLSAGNALITLANTAPPASEYLGQRFLPVQERPTYDVNTGGMEITTVMAGHVAMDSEYPKGTAIKLKQTDHETAKIAQALELYEEPARELQKLLLMASAGQLAGRSVADFMSEAGLNLYEKGVVQAIDDSREYLIMQALTQGKIDWTFNGRTLKVNYKLPEENRIELKGEKALDKPESGFWAAIDKAEKTVRGSIGIVMSEATLNTVLNNDAHRIQVVSDERSPQRNIRVVRIRKLPRMVALSDGNVGYTAESTGDQVQSVTLIGYAREGQIINPEAVGETIGVQMVSDKRIAVIGKSPANQLVSVTGTPLPQDILGYYHKAPTVEGTWRGVPMGTWGRLFTPENDPYMLVAEGVENGLPVIRNPERLVIIESE